MEVAVSLISYSKIANSMLKSKCKDKKHNVRDNISYRVGR